MCTIWAETALYQIVVIVHICNLKEEEDMMKSGFVCTSCGVGKWVHRPEPRSAAISGSRTWVFLQLQHLEKLCKSRTITVDPSQFLLRTMEPCHARNLGSEAVPYHQLVVTAILTERK